MRAEKRLFELAAAVSPPDPTATERAWQRLDALTKPPRSLGRIEEVAARVSAIRGTVKPSVAKKAVVLAAGDHGVVAEGISPYPQEVTRQMVANFAGGGAAINQIAESVGARLVLVDVGVASDLTGIQDVLQRKVAPGTANMAQGPAMTRDETARCLLVGADIANDLIDEGTDIIGLGEMGIGNTTAAAALTAAFAGIEPEVVCGPGTGLDESGVARKAVVVSCALEVNRTYELDALGVLAAVGGLEIACLAGVAVGASVRRVPVVADGFISGAAALAAVRLCPACAGYLLASHVSAEPGHRRVLEALGAQPVLELDMRLGEGTGAALAMGIIDAACRMMSGMATFAEAGVSGRDEAMDSDAAFRDTD